MPQLKASTQSFLWIVLLCLILPKTSLAQWEKAPDGRLPAKALRASTSFDGKAMYIARAPMGGGLHIGKTFAGLRHASIPYGGREEWIVDHEVYVGGGFWIPASNGQIPENAIKGGNEADGRPLYIARAVVEQELVIGKIQPGGSALIAWKGKEVYVNQYEVLTNRVVVNAAGSYEGLCVLRLFNGKVLQVDVGSTLNGAQVSLGDYRGTYNDLWRVQYLNNGYYKITNAANGKALSAWKEDVNKNGCRIVLWDYWGGDSQQWEIMTFSANKVALRCKGSTAKKALDIDKNQTNANGVAAQLYDYWQGLNQFWTIEKVPLNLPPDRTDISPPRISWEVRNKRTGETKIYLNNHRIMAERFGDSYAVNCIIEDPGGLKEFWQHIAIVTSCKCGEISIAGDLIWPPREYTSIPPDGNRNAPITLRKEFEQMYGVNTCEKGCNIILTKMAYMEIKNYAGLTTSGNLYFEYRDY